MVDQARMMLQWTGVMAATIAGLVLLASFLA